MLNRVASALVAVVLLACNAPAKADPVPLFSDNFSQYSLVPFQGTFQSTLNTTPSGWFIGNVIAPGGVDIYAGTGYPTNYGESKILCQSSPGCIDLDGSTHAAGALVTNSTFNFQTGNTYTLSAYISGNQRGTAGPDQVQFGFTDSGLNILSSTLTPLLPSTGTTFTLFQISFTPVASTVGRIFFWNNNGGDNVGPILDTVLLTATAVPLPASAWLLLSGLLALGLMARRRVVPAQ